LIDHLTFISLTYLFHLSQQVSSSCSSVYVDGSELRGSSNASVIVKYGTYQGLAKFTVWMPEFPLELAVADFKLSQIKGWKVPEEHNRHEIAFSLFHIQYFPN
jgi:hypothetical protein